MKYSNGDGRVACFYLLTKMLYPSTAKVVHLVYSLTANRKKYPISLFMFSCPDTVLNLCLTIVPPALIRIVEKS